MREVGNSTSEFGYGSVGGQVEGGINTRLGNSDSSGPPLIMYL